MQTLDRNNQEQANQQGRIELPNLEMINHIIKLVNKFEKLYNATDYRFGNIASTSVQMVRSANNYRNIKVLSAMGVLPGILFPVSFLYQAASNQKFRERFRAQLEIIERFRIEIEKAHVRVQEAEKHFRGARFSIYPEVHKSRKKRVRQFIHLVQSTQNRRLNTFQMANEDVMKRYRQISSSFLDMSGWSISDEEKNEISRIVFRSDHAIMKIEDGQPITNEHKKNINNLYKILDRALLQNKQFGNASEDHEKNKKAITEFCDWYQNQGKQDLATNERITNQHYIDFKNSQYPKYVPLFFGMSVDEWALPENVRERLKNMRQVLLNIPNHPPDLEEQAEMKELFQILERAVNANVIFSSEPDEQKYIRSELGDLCKLGPYEPEIDEVNEFRKFADLFMDLNEWEIPAKDKSRFYALRDLLMTRGASNLTQAERDEMFDLAQLLNDNLGIGRQMTETQKAAWEQKTNLFYNQYYVFQGAYTKTKLLEVRLDEYEEHLDNRNDYRWQQFLNLNSFMYKAAGGLFLGSFALSGSMFIAAGAMIAALPLAPVVAAGYWFLSKRFGKGKQLLKDYEKRQQNVQKDYTEEYRTAEAAVDKANQDMLKHNVRLKPDQKDYPALITKAYVEWGENRFMKNMKKKTAPQLQEQGHGLLNIQTKWKRFFRRSPIVPRIQNPPELTHAHAHAHAR